MNNVLLMMNVQATFVKEVINSVCKAGADDACSVSDDCGSGFFCSSQQCELLKVAGGMCSVGGECVSGICENNMCKLGIDDDCTGNTLLCSNSFCNEATTPQICEPLRRTGEQCTAPTQCLSNNCDVGGTDRCITGTGTSCGDDNSCSSSQFCNTTVGVCEDKHAISDPCLRTEACVAGAVCEDSICRVPLEW